MTTQVGKLKLILSQALVKYDAGLPLTVKEEELLAELYRRRYENRRETLSVDADGTVRVTKSVDAEPVMEAIKAYGDFIDTHTQRKQSQRLRGSVDKITAANWAKEAGMAVGTQEFAKFAINRIRNDIDYRKFRVGG